MLISRQLQGKEVSKTSQQGKDFGDAKDIEIIDPHIFLIKRERSGRGGIKPIL